MWAVDPLGHTLSGEGLQTDNESYPKKVLETTCQFTGRSSFTGTLLAIPCVNYSLPNDLKECLTA